MKKNWKLEHSLSEERFENAAQWNARAEGQIEKMGNLLHFCREAFLDIEKHSDDPYTAYNRGEFWFNYINEIAYNMNKIISREVDKHGLPVGPVAQAETGTAGSVENVPEKSRGRKTNDPT